MLAETVDALSGVELDLAVARYRGFSIKLNPMGFTGCIQAGYWIWEDDRLSEKKYQLIGFDYTPSSNWAQGGPIIQSNSISISESNGAWQATCSGVRCTGETPLIAAMRSFVHANKRTV